MTSRARAILHDIGLVERMLLMAGLAFRIERLQRNPVAQAIADDIAESLRRERTTSRQARIVALATIVPEAGMRARDGSGGKEPLRSVPLINKDGGNPSDYRNRAGKKTGGPPPMYLAIVIKIIFVLLGDLLLRASRLIHARLVTK